MNVSAFAELSTISLPPLTNVSTSTDFEFTTPTNLSTFAYTPLSTTASPAVSYIHMCGGATAFVVLLLVISAVVYLIKRCYRYQKDQQLNRVTFSILDIPSFIAIHNHYDSLRRFREGGINSSVLRHSYESLNLHFNKAESACEKSVNSADYMGRTQEHNNNRRRSSKSSVLSCMLFNRFDVRKKKTDRGTSTSERIFGSVRVSSASTNHYEHSGDYMEMGPPMSKFPVVSRQCDRTSNTGKMIQEQSGDRHCDVDKGITISLNVNCESKNNDICESVDSVLMGTSYIDLAPVYSLYMSSAEDSQSCNAACTQSQPDGVYVLQGDSNHFGEDSHGNYVNSSVIWQNTTDDPTNADPLGTKLNRSGQQVSFEDQDRIQHNVSQSLGNKNSPDDSSIAPPQASFSRNQEERVAMSSSMERPFQQSSIRTKNVCTNQSVLFGIVNQQLQQTLFARMSHQKTQKE